jgi:glycosyltransferase involved in cell wall biosynthesis
VSVLIAVRDEEERLPGALASVAAWAGEVIVVIDPRSRDRSREVALTAGAHVLEHPFASSAAQSNWGLEQCRHDWVFVLDADERVEPALAKAIVATASAPGHTAYSVRRLNYVLGKPLRFGSWGRDRIVRLVDRRAARFEERAVHGAIRAPSVGRLGGRLDHHTLRELEPYLRRLVEYARRGAEEVLASGGRGSVAGAVAHAEWRFVREYFLRLGFLDGWRGLLVAILAAHGSFLKWALVAEATRKGPHP